MQLTGTTRDTRLQAVGQRFLAGVPINIGV